MHGRAPRLRLALGATALTVVAALVGGLVATHVSAGSQTFPDVPPSHPFYAEIEGIARAGITTGFSSDGTYRPGQNVTRGAMAAFMGRGFGRTNIAGLDNISVTVDDQNTNVGTAVMQAGAASGQGGFVVITGEVEARAPESICLCELEVEIVNDGNVLTQRVNMIDGVNVGGNVTHGTTVQEVVPIAANGSESYNLRVRVDTVGAGTTAVSGSIIATYVPFSYDGNDPT